MGEGQGVGVEGGGDGMDYSVGGGEGGRVVEGRG